MLDSNKDQKLHKIITSFSNYNCALPKVIFEDKNCSLDNVLRRFVQQNIGNNT